MSDAVFFCEPGLQRWEELDFVLAGSLETLVILARKRDCLAEVLEKILQSTASDYPVIIRWFSDSEPLPEGAVLRRSLEKLLATAPPGFSDACPFYYESGEVGTASILVRPFSPNHLDSLAADNRVIAVMAEGERLKPELVGSIIPPPTDGITAAMIAHILEKAGGWIVIEFSEDVDVYVAAHFFGKRSEVTDLILAARNVGVCEVSTRDDLDAFLSSTKQK